MRSEISVEKKEYFWVSVQYRLRNPESKSSEPESGSESSSFQVSGFGFSVFLVLSYSERGACITADTAATFRV